MLSQYMEYTPSKHLENNLELLHTTVGTNSKRSSRSKANQSVSLSRDSIIIIEYDLRALRREGRRGYSKITGYMFTYKYIPEGKEKSDVITMQSQWKRQGWVERVKTHRIPNKLLGCLPREQW